MKTNLNVDLCTNITILPNLASNEDQIDVHRDSMFMCIDVDINMMSICNHSSFCSASDCLIRPSEYDSRSSKSTHCLINHLPYYHNCRLPRVQRNLYKYIPNFRAYLQSSFFVISRFLQSFKQYLLSWEDGKHISIYWVICSPTSTSITLQLSQSSELRLQTYHFHPRHLFNLVNMTLLLFILALLYGSKLVFVSAVNSSYYPIGQSSGILCADPELSSFHSQGEPIPGLAGCDNRRTWLGSDKWAVFKRWSCKSKLSRQLMRFSREIGP